jgi:hypothetical protein
MQDCAEALTPAGRASPSARVLAIGVPVAVSHSMTRRKSGTISHAVPSALSRARSWVPRFVGGAIATTLRGRK